MKILKFYATWCGPCKMLAKTLDSMGIKYEDIDVDSDDERIVKYGIRNVPTLIITNDKGELVKRLVGNQSKASLEKELKNN